MRGYWTYSEMKQVSFRQTGAGVRLAFLKRYI